MLRRTADRSGAFLQQLFLFYLRSGNFTPGVTGVTAFVSVVYVDSAIRWRRNGAVGLKGNCSGSCGCFAPVFCGFAIRRIARAAASRRGGSPLRLSPGSLLRRLRSLRSERAQVCRLRFKFCLSRPQKYSCRSQRGEFCEPPQGGASARPAKAGVYLKPRPCRTPFSSTFPRCRQLLIPVCRGVCEQWIMSVSRLQTLRPGPARIGDTTPAAGPGERFCRRRRSALRAVRAAASRSGGPQACPAGCVQHSYKVDALTFAAKTIVLRPSPHSS